MPDEKKTTKTCLECQTENAESNATCSACGGGSFPTAILTAQSTARELEFRAEEAVREARDAENTRWEKMTPAERQRQWTEFGARPPGMCKDCIDPSTPCRGCFAAAGYNPERYDAVILGKEPEGPETQPAPIPPVLAPPAPKTATELPETQSAPVLTSDVAPPPTLDAPVPSPSFEPPAGSVTTDAPAIDAPTVTGPLVTNLDGAEPPAQPPAVEVPAVEPTSTLPKPAVASKRPRKDQSP